MELSSLGRQLASKHKKAEIKKKRRTIRARIALSQLFGDINHAFAGHIPENDPARVETIVTLDRQNQRVNCYGKWIESRLLWSWLNLNCSTLGKRTTCWISYPLTVPSDHSCFNGFIIRSSELGLGKTNSNDRDFYLLFAGIPLDPDLSVIRL